METEYFSKYAQTADGTLLKNDLEELSRPVDDHFILHLSKVVIRKYAEVLIYSDDDFTDEKTLKKMKVFSAMSQDIARMRRADLAHRRAQIEETKVQNSHQRTEEQVIEQFKEWADIPEVRRCFILAPMEQMRRLRIIYGIPPNKDDLILQKIVEADPAFGKFEPTPDQIKVKPNSTPSWPPATEESEDQSCSSSYSTPADGPDISDIKPPKTTPDKTTAQLIAECEEYSARVDARKTAFRQAKLAARQPSSIPAEVSLAQPLTECPGGAQDSSQDGGASLPTSRSGVEETPSVSQLSTPPTLNPHLSDYEQALLEGKTHLEALYAQFTPTPEEFARRKRANEELRNPASSQSLDATRNMQHAAPSTPKTQHPKLKTS